MAVGSQTGEKAGNLRLAHLCRMALVVEQDKSFDPADIGLLRFIAVLPGTDRRAHLVEQFGFCSGCQRAPTDHFEFVFG